MELRSDDACLTGVGNQKINILGITDLKLTILDIDIDETIPFAVVRTEFMPKCCILGANFISKNHMILDFNQEILYYRNASGDEMFYPIKLKAEQSCSFLGTIETIQEENSSSDESDLECNTNVEKMESNSSVKYVLKESMSEIQDNDHAITGLKTKVYDNIYPKQWKGKHLDQFKRNFSEYVVRDNVLYREHSDHCSTVVPFSLMLDIVHKTHTQLGHVGSAKLYAVIRELFWHPAIEKICRDVCVCCVHCQLYKVHRIHIQPPTIKIQAKYPFELMSVDLMLLPKSKRNNVAVMVAIDSYSKWLTAVPLKNKTSQVVSSAFRYNILPNLPIIPTKILSDNGSEFKSEEFNNLLKEFNINHVYSTPYKPSSNGLVERSNRTIIQLLKGLISDSNTDWDIELHKVLITYNNTVHSQTKASPSNILLKESHKCDRNIPVNADIVKTWKAGNPKFSPFEVHQKVLRKIIRKGNQVNDKLKPRYDGPYKILKIQSNQVTYRIQKVDQPDSKILSAHYQQLRLFNEIPSYLKEVMNSNTNLQKLESDETSCSSSDGMTFMGFQSQEDEIQSDKTGEDQENLMSEERSKKSDENCDFSQTESNESTDNKKKVSQTAKSVMERTSLSKRNKDETTNNDDIKENSEENSLTTDANESLESESNTSKNTSGKGMTGLNSSINQIEDKSNKSKMKSKLLTENSMGTIRKSAENIILPLERLRCSEFVDCNDKGMTSTPCNEINIRPKFCGNVSNIEKIEAVNIISESKYGSNVVIDDKSREIADGLFLTSSEASSLASFLKSNEEAWSKSQDMIQEEMSKIQKSDKIMFDEEVFEGFGSVNPYKTIGSARVNFLKAYYNRTAEFRESASDYILRNMWLDNLMQSESRLKQSGGFSDEQSNPQMIEPINFDDSATPRRVTRSQGAAMSLPNVQEKILEYKK